MEADFCKLSKYYCVMTIKKFNIYSALCGLQEDMAIIITNTKRRRRSPPPQNGGKDRDAHMER